MTQSAKPPNHPTSPLVRKGQGHVKLSREEFQVRKLNEVFVEANGSELVFRSIDPQSPIILTYRLPLNTDGLSEKGVPTAASVTVKSDKITVHFQNESGFLWTVGIFTSILAICCFAGMVKAGKKTLAVWRYGN